jgi:hypothetical protein
VVDAMGINAAEKRYVAFRFWMRAVPPVRGTAYLVVALTLITHGLPADAQGQGAAVIRGVVEDPSRNPIPGAQVTLEDKGTGDRSEATSGQTGEFVFQNLALGEYILLVKVEGFEDKQLSVSTSEPPIPPLRVRLKIAEINEEVTVSANALSSLSADRNIDSIELDDSWLRNLPARDGNPLAVPLMFLDPAASGVGGPTLIVNGMESSALGVPAFSIERVSVNTNPYSAEFGKSGKGRIEVTTRRGNRTNFHGNVAVLMRNSALDARNAFAEVKPPLERWVLETDLYGPLGRRHAFYVTGRSYANDESTTINAATPAGRLVQNFVAPERNTSLFTREDFRFSSRHRLALTYQLRNNSQRGQGVGGFNLPERAKDILERENEVKILDTRSYSSNSLSELRVAFKHQTDETNSVVDRPATIVLDAFKTGGAQVSAREREVAADIQEIFSLARGRHGLRFGGGMRSQFFRARDASDFGGTFSFSSLATFNEGKPFRYTVNQGNPEVSYEQHEFQVFFQDEIGVRPDVSLLLGLRYEAQTDLGDHNNLGPRLALAYSPGGRRMVLRGGVGVFYERQPSRLLRESLLYDGTRIVQIVVSNPSMPTPFAQTSQVSAPAPSIVRVAPGIETPYMIQQSVGVEQSFGTRTQMGIEYTAIRGDKLYRLRNVNAPLPGTSTRPDPDLINVNQFETSGESRSDTVAVTFKGRFGAGFDFVSQYALSRMENDTQGLSSLPADNYNLADEFGRADDDRRHRLNVALIYRLPSDFRVGGIVNAFSGVPYNVTTGFDDNQDTVANDRPPGVRRNSGSGPGYARVDARISKRFRLERNQQRPELEVALDAFNLLNRVNFRNYVGVLSSPFFGYANAAQPARQLQMSVRFRF